MGEGVEKWHQPDTKNSVRGEGTFRRPWPRVRGYTKLPTPPYSKDEIQ